MFKFIFKFTNLIQNLSLKLTPEKKLIFMSGHHCKVFEGG